jgi:threonine/homoserine/homoserine lactone efflux protein
VLSAAGVSALIAASEIAFAALKIIGAVVLLGVGIQSLRRSRHDTQPPRDARRLRSRRRPFRDGLITSLSNPKLAVFFVALFPQFVGHRNTALPTTLQMAALIVVFDLAWYSTLAAIATRARRKFDQTRMARRLERLSGTILIGLGIRIATEHR